MTKEEKIQQFLIEKVNGNFEKERLEYILKTNTFNVCTLDQGLRYLKGMYGSNIQKIKDDLIFRLAKNQFDCFRNLINFILENYEDAKPFTYAEAFQLENETFRSLVFTTIDIVEMINNLDKTRLAVDGIPVKRKQFDTQGNFVGYKEYDNIYETYEINSEKIGGTGLAYAVRCWCTSTNKEHWIWIEDEYKDKPLDAIASTFRIHENVIPHIKELKRQGDVMLVELLNEVDPEGEIRALTKSEYFQLLTTES